MPYLADSRRAPEHTVILFLLAAAGMLAAPHLEAAAGVPSSDQAILFSANWTASVYSQHAGGTVCWIPGEDGSLRVEVLRDPGGRADSSPPWGDHAAPDLAPLLTRTGNGWTLVLGPDDAGTLNAWDREWDEVPRGLAQMVRLVTAALGDYPDRPPEISFIQAVGASGATGILARPKILRVVTQPPADEEVWRYQLASLERQAPSVENLHGFRREMVARGRGAGGPGEILVLRWRRGGGQPGYALSIRSSRRPGEFSLESPWRQEVPPPDPEVFLPLWPLSQFFEIR